MSEKQEITEEMGVHKSWYERARTMTPATLPEFLRELREDYHHDYGTVCHAVAASALGAAWAMNASDGARGGITGFQGGAVMWEFIAEWSGDRGKPMRLVGYDNMLYPQYDHAFAKTITADTWAYLQREAAAKLASDSRVAADAVVEHWRRIVGGEVPFGYEVRE